MNKQISEYINARYDRWADYSLYHSTHQGLADQYIDILNEVLEAVLKKDEDYLINLYNQKKNGYTGLDFLVLSMIKMYCTSPTAPYRYRYLNRLPIDNNITDLTHVDCIDEVDYSRDRAGDCLKEMRLVRFVFNGLRLTDIEQRAFEWRIFLGEKLTNYPAAEEEKKRVYQAYHTVQAAIILVLAAMGFTKVKKIAKSADAKRVESLLQTWHNTHKISVKPRSAI